MLGLVFRGFFQWRGREDLRCRVPPGEDKTATHPRDVNIQLLAMTRIISNSRNAAVRPTA